MSKPNSRGLKGTVTATITIIRKEPKQDQLTNHFATSSSLFPHIRKHAIEVKLLRATSNHEKLHNSTKN
jgi:hypothetical protein